MSKRVLIIKLGYCETLVNEQGFVPSLGDVFRHTVLLHRYADDHVTWLTSDSAVPLLRDNPHIQELLVYNEHTTEQLCSRYFDEVLCIEKAPTVCQLAQHIPAGRHYGFGWGNNAVCAHPMAQTALDIANGKDHFLPIQAILYQMVSDYWNGEDYILGYRPRPHVAYEVGLNYKVGSKWPTKAWPRGNWEKLAWLCEQSGIKVSWQEGTQDIECYMDWIHASRLVVTGDSLGMHLGLAMKKKVIALFGPTPSEGIYTYGRGIIIRANWACLDMPCMKSTCPKGHECMTEIRPEMIHQAIKNMLETSVVPSPSPARSPARKNRASPKGVLVEV